ncbi:Radical SAM domain protein [Desulfitobacterium hafniense DCB-2]|uniref:Radical SAM domain protein n=1 Tax=Desulfitobacterium hafniense (strain DSM 10664 / DCB-2) TaxID=272564 RepID=B8FTT9_DESHD|nr:radical SAM protein [Desulfitobacterium hafniense]ACL22181.1 Radical SAM domain protein [Desulfitobacterium hafniense DCB-2]
MTVPVRVPLIEHLPLATPFAVHMFTSYYCNFKCRYCIHSLDKEEQDKLRFKKQTMPMEIFQKTVDDLQAFPSQVKAMIFAGHGEPLTHPAIADMISYAKLHNAAERVEIVSNGSLLTPSLSDKLIEAKLDRLRISLQGLNEEDYLRVCGTKINFSEFVSYLEYFFRHKQHTDTFIKIIDIALNNPTGSKQFHTIFDSICDTAAIEYLFPFIDQIDHKELSGELQNTKHGDGKAMHVDICAMPFYMLVVLPNGDVTGCCAIQPPVIFGNVMKKTLLEIWNSEERNELLVTQILGRAANPVCKNCTVPDYGMQQGDYLDEYRAQLLRIFRIEGQNHGTNGRISGRD